MSSATDPTIVQPSIDSIHDKNPSIVQIKDKGTSIQHTNGEVKQQSSVQTADSKQSEAVLGSMFLHSSKMPI